MTSSLFAYTHSTEIQSGALIKAPHVENLNHFAQQIMGVVLQNGNIVTGVTTLYVGQNLYASGSANDGITLYASPTLGTIQTGGNGVASGNIINFIGLNSSVITADNTNNVYFNSTGVTISTPSGGILTGNTINFANGTGMAIARSGDTITFNATSGGVSSSSGSGALAFQAIYSYLFSGMTEEVCFGTDYTMAGAFVKLGTAPTVTGTTIDVYKNNTNLSTISMAANSTTGSIASSQSLVFGDVIKFIVSGSVDTNAGYPVFFGVY